MKFIILNFALVVTLIGSMNSISYAAGTIHHPTCNLHLLDDDETRKLITPRAIEKLKDNGYKPIFSNPGQWLQLPVNALELGFSYRSFSFNGTQHDECQVGTTVSKKLSGNVSVSVAQKLSIASVSRTFPFFTEKTQAACQRSLQNALEDLPQCKIGQASSPTIPIRSCEIAVPRFIRFRNTVAAKLGTGTHHANLLLSLLRAKGYRLNPRAEVQLYIKLKEYNNNSSGYTYSYAKAEAQLVQENELFTSTIWSKPLSINDFGPYPFPWKDNQQVPIEFKKHPMFYLEAAASLPECIDSNLSKAEVSED